jgi:hypothetical protein
LRSNTFFDQVLDKRTDLILTFFYILTLGTYTKFAWENEMLLLGVCFPQTCSGAGRMFAASRSRLDYYDELVRFHKNDFDEMSCKLDFSENLRLFEIYPCTTGGPEPSCRNKINKILIRDVGIIFLTILVIWYQTRIQFVRRFSSCFGSIFALKARGTCKSSHSSVRR